MTYLARLIFTLALAGAMFRPEFNRQEPISLDLKDASVTDVITMLGALANVPVSIAPDVSGAVTIQVTDVPYAKVLEMIGAQNGIALRFEGGKLVATRSQVALPATGSSVPAPKADRSGARLPVDAYARASASSKPLTLSVRGYGVESCARVDVEKGGGYEVPLPGTAEPAVITQFGWDPVTRTRFIAVEAPGSAPAAFAISDAQGLGLESRPETAGWSTRPQPAGAACREVAAVARRSSPGGAMIRMSVAEPGKEVVMAPQIGTVSSQAFSARSGQMGVSGQHDELAVFGYLAADGKSVAAALQATAIRTDPKDGREYVYSQISPADSIRFAALGADPVVLTGLPIGPARDRPLELQASIAPKR